MLKIYKIDFFLKHLDININCMGWELLIFNIIQQGTQVELYKYIAIIICKTIYHKYYQNPLKNVNYKHIFKEILSFNNYKSN